MKQLFSILAMCAFSIAAFAQQNEDQNPANQKMLEKSRALNQLGDNEIRLNIPYAIAGIPEINYERYLADNMGLGIAGAYSFEKVENMRLRYQLMPYARLYFGEKKASGFFIEANMGLIGQKSREIYYDISGSIISDSLKKSINAGFGAAAGAKFLARNGFVGEVYLGMGRLFGNSIIYAYPRLGICLGKRF
jgi:hypothetical protein